MISEIYESLKDNAKTKSVNPFFGSLFIILCFRNWRIIYTILYFDSKTTLNERIKILDAFYTRGDFWLELLLCSGLALLTIAGSYALTTVARLVVNFYENIIIPFVYKITDANSVVLKEDYNSLLEKYRELEGKLEKERESKQKIQLERDRLEMELNKPNEVIDSPEIEIRNTDWKKDTAESFAEKILKDYPDQFYALSENIALRKQLSDTPDIKYFAALGLIEILETYTNGNKKYKFTDLGIKVRDIFNKRR